MEPMEINAGRFHLRPLRQDGRVDDAPALTVAHGRGVYPEYFEDAAADAISHARSATRFASTRKLHTSDDAIATAGREYNLSSK